MSESRIWLFSAILLSVVATAGGASKPGVKLADLPAAVRKTILEQTQPGNILHLEKGLRDGHEVYAAQISNGVSSRTVRIDDKGAVLEVDEPVPLSKVAPGARKVIESSVGNGKIKKLEAIELASGLIAAYHVRFERNGAESELRIAPDGRLIPE